ncbi:TonB-dependent receptor [Shewanella eurypsychrophilus]|uniref:TonB-dependent receptor n=1 Tax=Shewanella eurypsychrophilus TaxID=2593656 RepID=A0ABX6V7W5_9GAMM|nr:MULTISPECIES: TonB-dependent receptor [Shewanella]QFU23143.1 TonB-dependent receptor [Shewanella sp. YLB-09]QPG58426.1 TonB-dependent receptor [Shewanella eurypsychrophilus]
MIKPNLLSLTAVAVSVALCSPVFADDQASIAADQAPDFEIITVTATRTERRLMESPLSSSVITSEEIETSAAANLADLLKDVPGVEVTDAATAGMKRIKIRGEASRRVAVLIDGQELTDHSSYGAPLLLDPAMVERIEVIRGTGSVLYGQKALGGVVNFITKKGGDSPFQASVTAGYDSATQGQQYSASAFGSLGDVDYRLSWSDNDHDNRETPEGELDETAYANNSIMAYVAYHFGDHTLGVNYDQYNMNSEIATGMPSFKLDMPRRDREKYSLFYEVDNLSGVMNKLHIDAYKQTIDRQFVQHMEMAIPMPPPMSANMIIDTQIDELLETSGVNGQFDFTLGQSHYLIAGLQYAKDEVDKSTHNQTEMTMVMPGPMPPQVSNTDKTEIENAQLTTSAVYLQDEWSITDDWLLTVGARQYWLASELVASTRGLASTESTDNQLVGSVATNYALSDDQNIRALVSQGYGYPTLLQTAMGATAAGTYINPNADLKAETSVNYELGYRFKDGRIIIDATAFYTDADDYLTTVNCATTQLTCINQQRDDIYINADKATSKGLELDTSIDFDDIRLYLSATWSHREQTTADFTTDKTGLPALYGRGGIKFTSQNDSLGYYWLDAYMRAASDADVQDSSGSEVEHYAGWGTVNLAIGNRFGKDESMMVSIEGTNLADKAYQPASQSLLATGRSIQAKFSILF